MLLHDPSATPATETRNPAPRPQRPGSSTASTTRLIASTSTPKERVSADAGTRRAMLEPISDPVTIAAVTSSVVGQSIDTVVR